jgi:hypothetical protein
VQILPVFVSQQKRRSQNRFSWSFFQA